MGKTRIVRAGVAALLIGAGLLGLGAAPAGAQGTGGGSAGSHPNPQCMQKCFTDWAANAQKCVDLFCWDVLFGLFTKCDKTELTKCLERADQVYRSCTAAC